MTGSVLTEWGVGAVVADSPRRVAIKLGVGSEQPGVILNIAKGTPGHDRLVRLNRKEVQ